MSITWSKAALRRHPAFLISETPRPFVPMPDGPAENETLQKAVEELGRIGRSLYRLGLTQESIARDLAVAARSAPQLDFNELRRRLAEDYLPVMDSLERLAHTLQARGEGSPELLGVLEPLAEGARIIVEKGRIYFESMGVVPIPALGADFDPNLHQAIETRPVQPEMDGKVVEEISRGYRLGDKLIRSSQVVVGKREQPAVFDQQARRY